MLVSFSQKALEHFKKKTFAAKLSIGCDNLYTTILQHCVEPANFTTLSNSCYKKIVRKIKHFRLKICYKHGQDC